jgi:hypothetical protein
MLRGSQCKSVLKVRLYEPFLLSIVMAVMFLTLSSWQLSSLLNYPYQQPQSSLLIAL